MLKNIKKVGIFTIYNCMNYGNRLQNYAVQEVLKELNTSPYTIVNIAERGRFRKKMESKFILKDKEKIDDILIEQKKEKFEEFNNKFISIYEKQLNEDNIKENISDLKQFDYFIVGSDQVWNYNIKLLSELNFLYFTDNEKKIAYAASLCLNKIKKEYREYYKKKLSDFKAISLREEKGKKILERLLHRKIMKILEPTLMIERKKWESIMCVPNDELQQKYILLYALTDDVEKNYIIKLSQEKNLRIIDINNVTNKTYFLSDPCEFLYLLKNAEYIITDSYHGAIFSIIFNKKCRLYKRKGEYKEMNCRIDTIFELLKLSNNSILKNNRKYVEFLFRDDIYNIEEIKKERFKAIKFLKESMNL